MHPSDHDHVFINKLKTVLKITRKEKKKVIICGDFNYNLLEYDTDKSISDFLNIMLENNLQLINTLEKPMSGMRTPIL